MNSTRTVQIPYIQQKEPERKDVGENDSPETQCSYMLVNLALKEIIRP